MKLLISLLHLFFCGNLIAQTLEIKSRKNSTDVPFASVKFFKKGIVKGGTYSNEKGLVYLDLTNDMDSIMITHLNYKSKKIVYNSNNKVVFLEENLIELAEIKISSNPNKKSIIGTTLNKENIFIDAKTSFEICSFIPSDGNINTRLTKFIFNVKRKKEKKDAVVKLHFYKNENNTPASLINFNQDITVILSFKKNP